ncbi:hypothetical protein ACPC54_34485 [Kitasatospora sp. NPDC094028]
MSTEQRRPTMAQVAMTLAAIAATAALPGPHVYAQPGKPKPLNGYSSPAGPQAEFRYKKL